MSKVKATAGPSSIVTRQQLLSRQTQATSNSSRRISTSSTKTPPAPTPPTRPTMASLDKRIKQLEDKLREAESKIVTLENELELAKAQNISQSGVTLDDLVKRIESNEKSLHLLLNDEQSNNLTSGVSRRESIVDSLSIANVSVINIAPTNISPTVDGTDNVATDISSPQTVSSFPVHFSVNSDVTNNEPQIHITTPPTLNKPKWKWFHLSSIVALTPEIIKRYVSNRLNNCTVKCFRLTFRDSRTFKVGVPSELGLNLWAPDFWPLGTIVRDFTVRKNFRSRQHTKTPT